MSGVEGSASASFPKASFDGIEFPYEDIQLRGGLRHTIHEFAHVPAGELEKMGRRPYVISFKALFHDIPGPVGFPTIIEREYPDLYPKRLNELRAKFDKETTADLVIPNVGKIKACAVIWNQRFDARTPSGESLDLEFVEDQEVDDFVKNEIDQGTSIAVFEANTTAQALAALADFKKEETLSVFEQIGDAVEAFQAALEVSDIFSSVIAGKLEGIANLCSYADSQVQEMQNPQNHLVVNALKDLWLAAQQLGQDVAETRRTIRVYNVPKLMAVGQIASTLYGDSSRGVDILQLNAFEDALAIPAGTPVRYLAA